MGAWDVGLFDDDVAVDIKLSFEGALEAGMTVAAATREALEEFEDYLDDEDDGPIVVLALAALQWEKGKLQERLKKRATAILESGQGLARWEDAGEPILSERRQSYKALLQQLNSPPPPKEPRPRRPRLNVQEGEWFGVPLEEGGYAVGVLARFRRGQYGPALFGYFFGPRRASLPSLDPLQGLHPEDAVYAANFSHLGLVDGTWPRLGRIEPWQPDLWPLPLFGRENALYEGYAWLVQYSEDSLEPISERPVKLGEIAGLPHDGLAGSGYVEAVLSDLLPPI